MHCAGEGELIQFEKASAAEAKTQHEVLQEIDQNLFDKENFSGGGGSATSL